MNSEYDYECPYCQGTLNYSHDEVAQCSICKCYVNFDEIQYDQLEKSYYRGD